VSGDICVREADKEDALCLHALATQVFLDTYATQGIREAIAREAQAELSVAAFLEQLANPSVRVLLAERNCHLVAFASVTLRATHTLLARGPAAELTRLYVQWPFVRQGVGSLLLRHVEAFAHAAGASALWLTAWVSNTRALAFYASQGYVELGSTDHEFENERFENRLFAKALVTAT
jgi:ribosomal protein S18 acetylase RimI-like enzyme